VIIADDHRIIREGLRTLIERHPNLEVIAEADDGRQAVRLTSEMTPDVTVLDISMPELNGIEAAAIKTIALSMHADKRFVIEMFKAGASAYLLKDCAFDELARAIREVLAGRVYISPQIGDQFLREYLRALPDDDHGVYSTLSHREREVLQLMAEGRTTRQIAGELGVSAKTIETHRKNIMAKLNLYTVAELTKYAIREGLTEA
jgi:DNA-binding NarL/FixJ family response regulator